jgi:hypothetical protein
MQQQGRTALFYIILVASQRWHVFIAAQRLSSVPSHESTAVKVSPGWHVVSAAARLLDQEGPPSGNSSQSEEVQSQIEELRAENEELQAKNKHLRASNKELTSELKELRNESGEHINDVDTGKGDGSEASTSSPPVAQYRFPWAAVAACGTLVVLYYAWMAIKFTVDFCKSNYELIGSGGRKYAFPIGSFAYWVAMPWTLFILSSTQSSCQSGAPDVAYAAYGVFLVIHLACAFAMSAQFTLPEAFTWDVMQSLPVLTLFMFLEHFDMATDTMFPGTAIACSDEVSSLWIHSWRQVPWIGPSIAGLLSEMGIGGFALTVFVISAYLPQLLMIFSFLVPIFIVITGAIVLAWVHFGFFIGPCVMLIVTLGLMYLDDRFEFIWDNLADNWMGYSFRPPGASNLAYWSGFLIFEDSMKGPPADKGPRTLFFGLTKIAFENMLQLWIQSSFFSVSFEIMSSTAKIKALISMGLGLAVSLSKLLPAFLAVGEVSDGRVSAFAQYVCLSLMVLFAIWIAAKLTFAYVCESHVWNLSSGCVALPP